jgi:hypothetical protein
MQSLLVAAAAKRLETLAVLVMAETLSQVE